MTRRLSLDNFTATIKEVNLWCTSLTGFSQTLKQVFVAVEFVRKVSKKHQRHIVAISCVVIESSLVIPSNS